MNLKFLYSRGVKHLNNLDFGNMIKNIYVYNEKLPSDACSLNK